MTGDDLIALAFELARREAGRPKSVSLRRAVSTAYYALFHALATLCANELVGQKPWPLYTPVYRALEHRRTRDVLKGMLGQVPKGSPLGIVAVAFVSLQDARHDADYNPQPFRLKRRETVEHVGLAQRAIAALNALSGDEKLTLAVKFLLKPR